MKLVWSPETASKAYIDTVKSCQVHKDSSVSELISAMAAGWNAQLIVETWSQGGAISTSIGLSIAAHHTRGRHVCIVPDQESKSQYIHAIENSGQQSAQVIVGRPEEAMESLQGIDFLVADCRQNDFVRMLSVAELGRRGAVLICKNVNSSADSDFRWRRVLGDKSRIVRSVFLPVGNGLNMAHIGGEDGGVVGKGKRRWIN